MVSLCSFRIRSRTRDIFEKTKKIRRKKKAPAAGKENTKPSGTSGRYVAIQTLTPYMNKWTIKGRVTSKDPKMRTWKNAKGEGCLFGFTLADETSDIKVTSFKEEAEK